MLRQQDADHPHLPSSRARDPHADQRRGRGGTPPLRPPRGDRRARAAATIYDVDVDTVLAISYHESHFQEDVATAESGGRVSCGAMTPYPTSACSPRSLLSQYLDGTRHWAIDWRRARDVRDAREALLGYAGGYRLIRMCRQGPVIRRGARGDDLCRTPDVFARIRARIRAARRTTTA